MRVIPVIERGCGTAKPGGFYLSSSFSPNGSLNAWSWCLGEQVMGGTNMIVDVPDREQLLINLPHSLATGTLQTEKYLFPLEKPLSKLPQVALIDHVGKKFYTPYTFYQEVITSGPSRRIPEQMARKIAPYLPLPIVFTHDCIPVVDKPFKDDLISWAIETIFESEFTTTEKKLFLHSLTHQPTWEDEEWGLRVGDKKGTDHWLALILKALDKAGDSKVKPLYKILPPSLHESIEYFQQPFGISWITRSVYISTRNEDQDRLDSIRNAGIEPVELDEYPEDDLGDSE